MTVINSNINALRAQSSLAMNQRVLDTVMNRLTTGLRINSAKDDAAGLAIANRMEGQIRGLLQAIRNANDGMSLAQTAEASLGEVSNMMQRMRELSVQASSGTMSTTNRTALQSEFSALVAEIDNIAKTTSYNGMNLLDGSVKGLTLQTGYRSAETVAMTINSVSSRSLGLQGFRIEGQLTTGRVQSDNTINLSTIAVDDILINGQNAMATAIAANTAAATATAINTNVGNHRVKATAFNAVTGVAPIATTFTAGDVTINGTAVGAAASVVELVSNINRDVSGLTATLNSDGTITLTNDTGSDIVIAANGIGTTAPQQQKAGFSAGTYRGFVSFESLDRTPITVTAKNTANGHTGGGGTLLDLSQIGLNESTNGLAFVGRSVSNTEITVAEDVRINGVQVGITSSASASSKAAAVNAIFSRTGVGASANTQLKVALDFTNRPSAAVKQVTTTSVLPGAAPATERYQIVINGYKIDVAPAQAAGTVSQTTASILGSNVAATVTAAAAGTATKSSALALALKDIINADTTASNMVAATSTASGDLVLTAARAGDPFTVDIHLTDGAGSDAIIYTSQTTTQNVFDGSDDIRINSKLIDVTGASDAQQLVSIINLNSVPGVVASSDNSGNLILTSLSGEDIKIENFSEGPGRFVNTVKSVAGEESTQISQIKIGGTIEVDDIFEIYVNGTAARFTAADTVAANVAIGLAAAINTSNPGMTAAVGLNADIDKINLTGATPSTFYNVRVNTLERLPQAPGALEAAGAAWNNGGAGFFGSRPVDGQTITLLQNGINMSGRITLSSATGAEIRIEDKVAGSAARLGLAQQGGSNEAIGGALSILTQPSAQRALTSIDTALDTVNLQRAQLGATQNRLDSIISNLTSASSNTTAARSRIVDVDYSQETTKLTKALVVRQAATAMLAQANQAPQTVLALLKTS